MMTVPIPDKMKKLVVVAPGKDVASCKIEMQEVPVPQPQRGEVLIKVAAAVVNPSDYGEWYRCNPSKCPLAMGKEGCGVVVASGGGMSLATTTCGTVGTKVGFVGLKKNQGSYSEYVVASEGVFAMPDDVAIEDCASFFVNPYTAVGILDTAQQEGSPALVHTAAASQLGQMIVKLAPSEGIEVINVVRREDQADMLRNIGAKHVVVTGSGTSDEEIIAWKEELKAKIDELGAMVAFDAVAGRMSGDLLDVIPKKGTVYVYGGLGGLAENINPMNLIYREKKFKGFFLSSWVKQGGMARTIFRLYKASGKVNSGLKAPGWSSSQFKDTTLEKAHADIVELIGSSITGQKLRIRFD